MKGRDVTGILVTVTIIKQAEISPLPEQGEGAEAALEARDPQVDIVPGGILDIPVHLGSQQPPAMSLERTSLAEIFDQKPPILLLQPTIDPRPLPRKHPRNNPRIPDLL